MSPFGCYICSLFSRRTDIRAGQELPPENMHGRREMRWRDLYDVSSWARTNAILAGALRAPVNVLVDMQPVQTLCAFGVYVWQPRCRILVGCSFLEDIFVVARR